MAKRPKTLSDQLRAIIKRDGRSRNRICREAGIDPAQLHRFVHGRPYGSFTLPGTLDRLAKVLGVRLVTDSE